MDGFVIDRTDGRADGESWTENYEELPGSANISIILESTTKAGVGAQAAPTSVRRDFIIRRGWTTVVRAHIHANPRFITEWLE